MILSQVPEQERRELIRGNEQMCSGTPLGEGGIMPSLPDMSSLPPPFQKLMNSWVDFQNYMVA
jgi:hypothetical protein